MKYNFDEIIDRHGTVCEKYDDAKRIFNEDVLPMWIADTDFKTPDFIVSALKTRLDHEIFGYSFRCKYYYEAVRSWLYRRNGWDTRIEWMDFTPGVVCGLTFGIQMFTAPGDNVVIQPPVYPPFARTIELNDRKVVNNPLRLVNGKYEIDFEDLDRKLTGAKLFILCNPHNPTGRVFTFDELRQIGELCLKHGVPIVSDEIHADLVISDTARHIHIASVSEAIGNNTLTFIAPSKTFNIAGLSTSVAIIPNPELHKLYSRHLLCMHVDQGNIFGAVALRAAYSNGDEWLDQFNCYIAGNVDYVLALLKARMPKIKCARPEGTFLMWLDFNELGLSHEELCDFMIKEAKLGLNSGTEFGEEGTGFMRLNVGCPRAVLDDAMTRLEKAYRHRNF